MCKQMVYFLKVFDFVITLILSCQIHQLCNLPSTEVFRLETGLYLTTVFELEISAILSMECAYLCCGTYFIYAGLFYKDKYIYLAPG